MQTQFQHPRPRTHGFDRQVVCAYVWTCRLLFGKTLSFMAGEAQAQGKWAGCASACFINWLLRDPFHCQNELRGARYEHIHDSAQRTAPIHCLAAVRSGDDGEGFQAF